jgi:hypothetical protein
MRRTAAILAAWLMSLLLGCHRATAGSAGLPAARDEDGDPVLDDLVGPAEPPLEPEQAVSSVPVPRARKARRSMATHHSLDRVPGSDLAGLRAGATRTVARKSIVVSTGRTPWSE